jgi:hypothetical protein
LGGVRPGPLIGLVGWGGVTTVGVTTVGVGGVGLKLALNRLPPWGLAGLASCALGCRASCWLA